MSKKASEKKKRRPEKEQQQPEPPASDSDNKAVVFVDRCEVPVRYDRTGITLIARDPYSVYAYWEISPSSLREARSRLSGEYKKATLTLRMLDITGIDFNGSNAKGQFDVDLDPATQSRYIILPNDNVTICADLGLKTAAGLFYRFARSNVIATPSANESDCMETTWVKVRHKEGLKPYVVARTFPLPQERAIPPQHLKASLQSGKGRQEEPVAGTQAHAAADETGEGDAAEPSPTKRMTGRAAHGAPEGAVTAADDGEPVGTREREGNASFELRHGGPGEKTCFSADLPLRSPFSADIIVPSSPAPGGGSERFIQGKDFFFQVDADLIVYGKTQPGAKVSLNDQPLSLREDGSFTVRFALPDGMLPLDFKSLSPDGSDTKAVSLTVERNTTVHQ